MKYTDLVMTLFYVSIQVWIIKLFYVSIQVWIIKLYFMCQYKCGSVTSDTKLGLGSLEFLCGGSEKRESYIPKINHSLMLTNTQMCILHPYLRVSPLLWQVEDVTVSRSQGKLVWRNV